MRKLKVCNSLCLLTYSILGVAGASNPMFGSFTPQLDPSTNTYLIKLDQSLSNPFHSALPSQAEYAKHFSGSNNLWGVKFLSNYLGLSAQDRLAQSFKSPQTNIDHELGVLAYIGRSFANGHVYLGGGPSLFGTKSNVYDVLSVGEATRPTNDLNNSWNAVNSRMAWGGAAQLGMSYYFDPTWYLDLNYTYAITGHNNNTLLTSQPTYPDVGPFLVNSTQHMSAQALALSVKKFFTF